MFHDSFKKNDTQLHCSISQSSGQTCVQMYIQGPTDTFRKCEKLIANLVAIFTPTLVPFLKKKKVLAHGVQQCRKPAAAFSLILLPLWSGKVLLLWFLKIGIHDIFVTAGNMKLFRSTPIWLHNAKGSA